MARKKIPRRQPRKIRRVKLPSDIKKVRFLRYHRGWIYRHPAIANAIVWRDPNGVPRAYPAWSTWEQDKLRDTVANIHLGVYSGLPATPPVTLNLSGSNLFSAELDPQLSWEYFIAYVAHSIVVEQAKWAPWSVAGYAADELSLLFDSHSLFEWSSASQTYGILRDHNILFKHGAATPGDPVRTFDFLNRNGLIGSTARQTIERLLDWCRGNLVHFYGGWDPANLQGYWQYDAWPPVERIISGTTHPQYGNEHWTAGCWGTTGFLRAVLRSVNIPVKLERRCGHALPHFVREGLYLSHGDDPYNRLSKDAPRFPIGELLIDQAKFDAWFAETLPETTICNNIGRRPQELRGLP